MRFILLLFLRQSAIGEMVMRLQQMIMLIMILSGLYLLLNLFMKRRGKSK